MKQNPNYTLHYIDEKPYLIASGQAISDGKKDYALTESGTYIWSLLANDISFEELIKECIAYYNINTQKCVDEIKYFVDTLIINGIVIPPFTTPALSPTATYYLIAEHLIIMNLPTELIHDNFKSFLFTCSQIDEYKTQYIYEITDLYSQPKNGNTLINTTELTIVENVQSYTISFHSFHSLKNMVLSLDGKTVFLYHSKINNENEMSLLKEEIFNALRLSFFFFIQRDNKFTFHSSSILYKNKAWLFSAQSGVGKSTHTSMWNSIYYTPYLNGDINVIGIDSLGNPCVYGIPWCGTSNTYTVEKHYLGGIILLAQAAEPHIEDLEHSKKTLLLSHRILSPNWTVSLVIQNIDFSEYLANKSLVCKLFCNTDIDSVNLIKAYIDNL